MVEVYKLSANYKLIIIENEYNLENKIIKEKIKILYIIKQNCHFVKIHYQLFKDLKFNKEILKQSK